MNSAEATLRKTLDALADLSTRLDRIDGAPLPLWMQKQGSGQAANASPWPSPPSYGAPLAKAAVGLPGGSTAEAVLSALLSDPAIAEVVRMKIEQMRSF